MLVINLRGALSVKAAVRKRVFLREQSLKRARNSGEEDAVHDLGVVYRNLREEEKFVGEGI